MLKQGQQMTWLVTGCAGFIGSHLVEYLLDNNQKVRGLDNFSTGKRENLPSAQNPLFQFQEGDIACYKTCEEITQGVDIVLHQAALGSVPRSIDNPLKTHESNATGFLNMLYAAKEGQVSRFVYASSSSVYGDHSDLPKVEGKTGNPLSPYAVTKSMNELYAHVFAVNYNFASVGLRYFNVFGPRQNLEGPYAAVIPTWIREALAGSPLFINGQGDQSRDFCYIQNAVQANIKAALTGNPEALNRVYNVTVGERTRIDELAKLLIRELKRIRPEVEGKVEYREERAGDVKHSLASIAAAQKYLNYQPEYKLEEGLTTTVEWFVSKFT